MPNTVAVPPAAVAVAVCAGGYKRVYGFFGILKGASWQRLADRFYDLAVLAAVGALLGMVSAVVGV